MSNARQLANAASSFNSGGLLGLTNKIINGGLDVWQRGTTFTNWGSFAYLVDRMRIGYDGSPASGRTLSQQLFTPGQTDVPEGDPVYYLRYVFPACGTPTNYIRWDIESVRTLAGQVATFSFWARVPSGTMSIGAAICQEFGAGGSSGVYPSQTPFTVTTTWKKFVCTQTMPSVSGKIIGSGNDDRIWPAVWMPPNAAGTIEFANFKLEAGPVATPFQRLLPGMELNLCKRYLQFFGAIGAAASSSQIHAEITFPVQMRATPSSYGLNPAGATCVQLNRAFFAINSLSGTFYSTSRGAGLFINSADTGLNVGVTAWASPDSIYADAEL